MADIKTLVEEAKGRLPDFGRACAYGPDEARIKTGLAICEVLDALAEAHQAEVARLTRENEGLATDNAICRDAIAHALELVEQFAASPDGDDDMSQGAARATRRRLNEAIGQMRPRLMMEKDLSPKFGLRWKELRAENEGLAKDAARYRWLRAGVSGQRDTGGVAYFQTRVVAPVLDNIMRGSVAQHYDAAIDALSGASGADEGERT